MFLILRSVIEGVEMTSNVSTITAFISPILRGASGNLSFDGLFLRHHLGGLSIVLSQVYDVQIGVFH